MKTQENLRQLLFDLDNRGYKAYKDIVGTYEFPNFTLIIDYVQGDPFAAPSKFRVQIPPTIAEFPAELYRTHSREIALRDYLIREFDQNAIEISSHRGTGKSGMIAVTKMGQEILERTAASTSEKGVEMRFFVGSIRLCYKIIPQSLTAIAVYRNTIRTEVLLYNNLLVGYNRKHDEHHLSVRRIVFWAWWHCSWGEIREVERQWIFLFNFSRMGDRL